MSRDLNKILLSGRLGKDVELKHTPNGDAVTTFSVASSRSTREGDSWKEQTEWFRVVAWQKLAEFCANNIAKGSHVFIEGRLQTREYTDASGTKRFSTEVIATEVVKLDTRSQNQNNADGGDGDFDQETAGSGAANRNYANANANANANGNGANYNRRGAATEELLPEDIPF